VEISGSKIEITDSFSKGIEKTEVVPAIHNKINDLM
jgi:hypothetical protein